tara:strand:- start:78241 stop:78399 length:159 start_codon:yes stop_codon:yes gene_type:complete
MLNLPKYFKKCQKEHFNLLIEKESTSMASEIECHPLMVEMFYQEEGPRAERG